MSATVERFCSCGASYTGKGMPPAVVEAIGVKFDEVHDGAGHGPATKAEARNARRRAEAAEERLRQTELRAEGAK